MIEREKNRYAASDIVSEGQTGSQLLLEGGRRTTYQFLMLFQVPGTQDVDRVPETYIQN